LLNKELAFSCDDKEKLLNAYMEIINRYTIDTVDFDLEGDALKDIPSLKRRAVIVADLQKKLGSENKKLAVWLTLPVSTQGLTDEGANAISNML
jgi:chitinase